MIRLCPGKLNLPFLNDVTVLNSLCLHMRRSGEPDGLLHTWGMLVICALARPLHSLHALCLVLHFAGVPGAVTTHNS